MVIKSNSENDTKKIACGLADKLLKTGGTVALIGELGAGKTTFTKFFAGYLGIKENVISPTFILQREYKIPNSKKILFHLDLYRLESEKDSTQLGLNELFGTENIILIEWADKIKNQLPKKSILINFKKVSENSREISISKK